MFPFDVENSRFSGFKMVQAEVDVDELSPSHSRNLGFDKKKHDRKRKRPSLWSAHSNPWHD